MSSQNATAGNAIKLELDPFHDLVVPTCKVKGVKPLPCILFFRFEGIPEWACRAGS